MKKHKKWLSVCLVVCLIGGLGGVVWYIPGGRLAAICLDTGEEFYVSSDMDCKQE